MSDVIGFKIVYGGVCLGCPEPQICGTPGTAVVHPEDELVFWEGMCPNCHGMLTVPEGAPRTGWCPQCQISWMKKGTPTT